MTEHNFSIVEVIVWRVVAANYISQLEEPMTMIPNKLAATVNTTESSWD